MRLPRSPQLSLGLTRNDPRLLFIEALDMAPKRQYKTNTNKSNQHTTLATWQTDPVMN
jgi:hypothetical protein